MNDSEVIKERYGLVVARLRKIPGERFADKKLEAFFAFCTGFLLMIDDTLAFLAQDGLRKASVEELESRNQALYADILPEHYEESYANPAYAVRELGEERGRLLSALYAELRSLIGFVYEGRLEELVIRMELFVEVYTAFTYAAESGEEFPSGKEIRDMFYWFACDYAELASKRRIREQLYTEECFAVSLIMESDLTDIRYLYGYGEYVSRNERETAAFMAGLSDETIAMMADTCTEGFRIGFETTGADLSQKNSVDLYYRLGFERMMRRVVENFAKMGLKSMAARSAFSVLDNRGASRGRSGFCGGIPNMQYDYDHKNDKAVFFDKYYVNRKLEANRAAYEENREAAAGYAGSAVVETFGEADFYPITKKEAFSFSKEQNRLWTEYRSRAGQLQREYISAQESSFTIIAFPVPEIGPVFQELFHEIIRINTLDYRLYRRVQQTLIDALDTADYCEVKGSNGNRTDLKINLYKLSDPARETIFENCVADVNIPVGEVFTSPVLKGTEGILHVSRVFLRGLEYKNLIITFEDGMIKDYSCDNYASEEENRQFIRENILMHHDTLPMGEFAIGTNTTAFMAARRLGVEAKLPILIAEKMGPHFAVGDTCYAHAEAVKVYNPDGKEIVAKANEVSNLRESRPMDAYYNCHTDITIPYDELGELTAVRKDGSCVVLIRDGRFVLPGCEELNKAFEE